MGSSSAPPTDPHAKAPPQAHLRLASQWARYTLTSIVSMVDSVTSRPSSNWRCKSMP
jgi:hypothetical protein